VSNRQYQQVTDPLDIGVDNGTTTAFAKTVIAQMWESLQVKSLIPAGSRPTGNMVTG